MLLTVDTVAARLLALGLLDPEDLLSGDLEITTINRRNRNLLITSRGEANYLVKQGVWPSDEGDRTLLNEARVYAYCFQPARAHLFGAFMPRVVRAAPEENMLIISLFKGAATLWKYYQLRTVEHFPVATVSAVGKLLRQFHNLGSAESVAADPALGHLRVAAPFVVNLAEPELRMVGYLTPGAFQIMQKIQAEPVMLAALHQMRTTWQASSLIHGDIKMDNFLVLDPNAAHAEGSDQVRLIDWELAQLGDPAWDVAGVLQDFVFWWVSSMPLDDRAVPNPAACAAFPAAIMQAGARAFWHGYCQHDPATKARLPHVVNFVACRLLQTAYEFACHYNELPRLATMLLRVAHHLLANPAQGVLDLFGQQLLALAGQSADRAPALAAVPA